jgi:hypothetical protein
VEERSPPEWAALVADAVRPVVEMCAHSLRVTDRCGDEQAALRQIRVGVQNLAGCRPPVGTVAMGVGEAGQREEARQWVVAGVDRGVAPELVSRVQVSL